MRCSNAWRSLTTVAVAGSLLLIARAGARAQSNHHDDEFQSSARARAYVHSLVGPAALIGTGLATGIDQYHKSPAEWGDHGEGLAKRAASNVGWLVVGQSVNHGLAILGNRSTEYHPCDCTGFGRRVGHAFVETVTVVDPEGHRSFAYPRFAGAIGGSLATMLWRPGQSAGGAALSGGGALLFGFLANAVREALGGSL